ncbi:glycosyltransferase family 2 protein [Sphingomonas profundi]|uniref:glycosyltransferase family 2 protein n=1 Tax=Alterirhizorhabdus profundi TaxID=2681549 RepID=UPI0012E8ABDA|nr:glycosyltransferase family 2 protein [Sphingomonas profundi]
MTSPDHARFDVSLIVATLGRTIPNRRLLTSLAKQRAVSFEVIVVDQNDEDILAPYLHGDWPFPVTHMRRPGERGASRARNCGWPVARAPVLLFPDDDSWYPTDFLARGLTQMADRRVDILTGRSTDETGLTINDRYARRPGRIGRHGVWTRQIEWITFFRRDVVQRAGGFDETIGLGAPTPWQAGEGPDLILRAIANGATAWYDPGLTAFHDELPTRNPDAAMMRKGRAYARGMGRVLRRRRFPVGTLLYWCGRALLAMLRSAFALDWRRARYFFLVFLGRLEGYAGRVWRG